MGLEELYAQYHRDVFRYLLSLCRDASLAEELASDTWLEAVRSFRSYRGESSVRTWLFACARHCWLRHIEKSRIVPAIAVLSELEPDTEQNVEREAQMRELLARIRAFLRDEPERNQAVFQLRTEGYSFSEISRKLQISENSARVIFFRTKERIRNRLQKEGLQYE